LGVILNLPFHARCFFSQPRGGRPVFRSSSGKKWHVTPCIRAVFMAGMKTAPYLSQRVTPVVFMPSINGVKPVLFVSGVTSVRLDLRSLLQSPYLWIFFTVISFCYDNIWVDVIFVNPKNTDFALFFLCGDKFQEKFTDGT
jgi:hypothetical protein